MPEEPNTPSPEEPSPAEPIKFASSDHPSGDTWRMDQTPTPVADRYSAAAAPHFEIIGDFEVIGQLGQGGMGTVYRARQISLNRQVALKILPTRLATDPEYVARFQREARVAANLAHPNLVRVYASGSAAGCHYIAMELIEGETVADWLRRGPMPMLDALRVILDVTHALECGWRTAHLIHRDIKPGNIFLSEEGMVKLGDLGLAKTAGSETTGLTQTGAMMGTPHYISPEQARGNKELDFRADIYSLGCTLYQILSGRTPYSGGDALAVMSMHLNAPPPAILKVLPHCPIPLARLVGRMLKKQRRERQSSYEELIAQIETVRAQLDPSCVAPVSSVAAAATSLPNTPVAAGSAPVTTKPGKKKSPVPLYAVIGAVVAVAAIVGWLAWPKEEKLTAAQRYARDHVNDQKELPDGPKDASVKSAEVQSGAAAAEAKREETTVGSEANSPWRPLVPATEWQAVAKGREFQDGLMQSKAPAWVWPCRKTQRCAPGRGSRKGRRAPRWRAGTATTANTSSAFGATAGRLRYRIASGARSMKSWTITRCRSR
jgi:serine/threonine protein kinase